MTALHVIARRVVHQGMFTYELALWNNGTVCAEIINAETLQPMQSASILANPEFYEQLAKDDSNQWIERIIAWSGVVDPDFEE